MENIVNKMLSFYPVSEEALEALRSCMTREVYPRHTYIVQTGRMSDKAYFIESGITRSVFHHDGVDTTTWFSMEGDVTFGMYSFYHSQPSVESVQTLTDCIIYSIPIERLNELYGEYIDIANWGRVIHQDVNRILSHVFVDRLQLSPRERYDHFLEMFPGVINRVKLKLVAEFLGMSIYTLSRVRSKW